MIRRAALAVLTFLDRVAQVVVPPKGRQIAWASDPDYTGNAYHLYRHVIATRPGHQHVWLIADADQEAAILGDLRTWGTVAERSSVRVVDRHSVRGYWHFLRSRRVFHTHGVYRWVRSSVRRHCVSLWHGMPIKAIGALNTRSPNPNPTYGDLHVATSEAYRSIIAAAFRTREDRVLLAGLPRCDVLAQPSPLAPSPDQIRAAMGTSTDERLVLWLPTYRTPANMRDVGPGVVGFRTFLDDLTTDEWTQVDRHAADSGTRVVVKLHPGDALNLSDYDVQRELGLQQVELVHADEWIRHGIELYDLLACTDGLITDVSSVLIDWLPTDRPLGVVGFDPDTYTRDVVIDVERLLASPRILDLSDPDDCAEFFAQLGVPDAVVVDRDLDKWIHPRLAPGSETILGAVGL